MRESVINPLLIEAPQKIRHHYELKVWTELFREVCVADKGGGRCVAGVDLRVT